MTEIDKYEGCDPEIRKALEKGEYKAVIVSEYTENPIFYVTSYNSVDKYYELSRNDGSFVYKRFDCFKIYEAPKEDEKIDYNKVDWDKVPERTILGINFSIGPTERREYAGHGLSNKIYYYDPYFKLRLFDSDKRNVVITDDRYKDNLKQFYFDKYQGKSNG